MREQLFVDGKEAADCDLKKLAAGIDVGHRLSGYYRYFLFGNKPCNMAFEIRRTSARIAVMDHLEKKHRISIPA